MAQNNHTTLQVLADRFTQWVGSISSLIVHTLFFLLCFLLPLFNIVTLDKMLLVLTTLLSLEAIYLAIFIQMAVNKSHDNIEDLKENVTEIQEDIEEINEDIEGINEDIEEIQEDIEEINEEDEEDYIDTDEDAGRQVLQDNITTNKNEITLLKEKIAEMQQRIEQLQNAG